jgi:hypothetical protein
MTNLNITSSAQLIRPNVAPEVTDLQFTDTDLLNFFESRGWVKPNDGGSPYRWNIKTGTTVAAEIFVEGQALPAPGTPLYTQASVAATYWRVIIANTGHLRDQIARGGIYQDPVAIGVDNALKMLRVLIDSTLAGSAANRGLASIIDAADVYGGIDPATVTNWASYEVNVGGAMTLAALNTMWRTLVNTPRGANPTDVLVSLLQFQRYTDLGGPTSSAAQYQPRRDAGLPYDMGMMKQPASLNGVPWTPIRSLATSELYMIDPADGFELREQRSLEVEKLAKVNDDDTQVMSQALVPVVKNRQKQAKLTGLT